MKTLRIGGSLVQTSNNDDGLTLLKDQIKLRSMGYYHGWSVNGETLQDTTEILNKSNNDLFEIEYFDGTNPNVLMIKGGLVKTRLPLKEI